MSCYLKKVEQLWLGLCLNQLAVTSPSRHFRDLAKKSPKQKRTDKLK